MIQITEQEFDRLLNAVRKLEANLLRNVKAVEGNEPMPLTALPAYLRIDYEKARDIRELLVDIQHSNIVDDDMENIVR